MNICLGFKNNSFFALHTAFWQRYPALLWGLTALIGALLFRTKEPFVFSALLTSWSLYCLFLRKPFLWLFLAVTLSYNLYTDYQPTLRQAKWALCKIDAIQERKTPFSQVLQVRGTLYFSDGSVPCSIQGTKKFRPKGNRNYWVFCELSPKKGCLYPCKVHKWVEGSKNYRLVETRFVGKKKFHQFLQNHLSSSSAHLFSMLLSGEGGDRFLTYCFQRLGLQHILAISGFHFGILLLGFSLLLQNLLPKKSKVLCLMGVMHLYFLFVGISPSIQRSWLTAELYLAAKLFRQSPTGLNLLGVALLAEMLVHPDVCVQIGFQLSYLSCWAILFFYPVWDRWLQKSLPKRDLPSSFAARALVRCSIFLRQGMSLQLAVYTVLWPALLLYFHQIPLLSLFYNLFIPLWITTLVYLLLFSSLIYSIIPLLATPLFACTDFLTQSCIQVLSCPPMALMFSIQCLNFPLGGTLLYWGVLFHWGICKKASSLPLLSPLGREKIPENLFA